MPFVGPRVVLAWDELVASGVAGIEAKVTPYASRVTGWLFSQAGVVGALSLQFLLTVVIAGLMYAQGESAANEVRRFGRRLGGARGEDAVVLAGKAIRGVALGVGVTAIVQAVVGVSLAIAGVPFAALLTAVMFMLCIVQLGPTLVLAPATIWVFWNGSTGWGVFLLVWTVIVGTMDNFLRPWLIKRGADLPLLRNLRRRDRRPARLRAGRDLRRSGAAGGFHTLINAWLDSADPSTGEAGPGFARVAIRARWCRRWSPRAVPARPAPRRPA